MPRVLVVADDECIRVSCGEVLRSLGLQVAFSWAPSDPPPDVVLLWDGLERDIRNVGVTLPGVPLVVCTYDHRRPWPGTAAVVALPFDAQRLARVLARVAATPRATSIPTVRTAAAIRAA